MSSLDQPANVAAAQTHDLLIVLRWTHKHRSAEVFAAVEQESIRGEVDAVSRTQPTTGSHDFIRACHTAGRALVILSNNAPEAINAYLKRFDLVPYVDAVLARAVGDPDLMKPNRHLVDQALAQIDEQPHFVAFIGDSVTDIEVGRATGIRTIGHAKTPRRGHELDQAGPDAITPSMGDLASLLVSSGSLI